MARQPDDHLPGLNDFPGAWTDRRYDAGRVRLEFGEAHQIMCDLQLGFGRIDLRLRGVLPLRCDLEIGAGGPPLTQQRLLTIEMTARLGQLPLCGRKTRLRLPQCVQLVLGFEFRDDLSGLYPISEFAAVLQQAAWYPKCQCHFVFRFNVARKRKRHTSRALLDRRRSDGTGYRNFGFRLLLACHEEKCGSMNDQ